MELITVVVSVYNMEKYLKRAIDSLIDQTYQNYEIILVDDGSTDGSGAICDEYAITYQKIRVLHKENGGLSSARNAGMEKAVGTYVIFPDPDDWVEPNYLQFLIELQHKYNADLTVSGHFVDSDKRSRIQNEKGKECILNRDEALDLVLRPHGFCGFAWNRLYHIDVIRKHNLKFGLEYGMAQDLYFAFEYLLICKTIVYDPTPTYHYFQHEGGVTNSKLTKRKISGLLTFESLKKLASKEAPFVTDVISGTIANLCMSFTYTYFDTKMEDIKLLNHLHNTMKENKSAMLHSVSYSLRHKVFFELAYAFPKAFYLIKKSVKGYYASQ